MFDPIDIEIPVKEYNKLFAEITMKAHTRMIDGYSKYGDTLEENFDFIKEAEEEIADAINYLVMGLHKMRKIEELFNNYMDAKIKEEG
jgi:hypothetical protein